MSPTQGPTITVVIPAYNAGKEVVTTLDSILAQDDKADEILVVDDGSTDNTAKLVEQYGDKVKLISQENQGAARARYNGVVNASSDVIVFCDAGDFSNPHKIKVLRNGFREYPDAVACFGTQWNKERKRPERSRWIDCNLNGSMHLIKNPFQIMLSRPGPLAWVMDIGIRKEVAIYSVDIPAFYTGANDYVVQLKTSTFGPFVHISTITTEFHPSPGGLSEKLGLPVQYAFSLCGAAEIFESTQKKNIDRLRLQERVNDGLSQALLSAYQHKRWPLFRRLLKLQIKYGSNSIFIRRLWWALKNSERDGKLDRFPILKNLTRLGLTIRGLFH